MAALTQDALAMREGDGRFSFGNDWASISFADYNAWQGVSPSAQHADTLRFRVSNLPFALTVSCNVATVRGI